MMQASPADVDHDVDDDYEIRRSVESLKSEEATRTRSNSSSTPDEHHNNDDTTAAMDDDNRSASSSSFDDYIPIRSEQISSSEPFVPPLKRDDAPLASILDARLQNINPASGMRSSSKSQIWWSSKTSKKRAAAAAAVIQQATSQPTDEISNNVPTTSATGLYATDDELLLMRPIGSQCSDDNQSNNIVGGSGTCDNSDAQPWRSGPARIWYDQSGIGREFNYGFKLKQGVSFDIHRSGRIISVLQQRHQNDDKLETTMTESSISARPDHQTFLSINLVRWEDNIVYDGEDIRDSLTSGKQPACGWVPTQHTRTYETFISALRNGTFEQMFSKNLAHSSPKLPSFVNTNELDLMRDSGNSLSIFPSDNYELTNTNWEEDIILDADNMDFIPEPKVLTLDFWDDAKIFGMPEDRAQDQIIDNGDSNSPPKQFDRKEHQFTKKSKMILGQVQQRQKLEEEEQLESSLAQMTDKDPFNMSNDEHYLPKNTSRQIQISGAMLIQHSIPAQNIHRMFFPTHLNPFKLRHFHRLPLSKRILRQVGSRFVHMQKLTKHIRQQENLRESQRQAEGGGEIFFMRTIQDISGRDGILMIFEYSEEHPPFLNQPGMASKIRNYYKRKSGKEIEPTFDFGETAFTHTSPFLGNLAPGQALQALENNLYRAPIYRHSMGRNDFLLIRNKQGFFIRTCPLLFCVGQQCPLYEVPSPNSKRATVFVRDFLLAFIYRLFWASDQNPRRLKMEDIKAAFPHYAESSVRKRLKQCSDFKRLGQGTDQNYWVLRQDFRLPSKEEVLAMVTPEMCCAQYSMLAAEQRLKDAGYGEKYFFTPENEDDSDDQVTMEDEIKCAPWCTTRAYISATKGKCLLDQTGIADPTGCGQGFSYVRVSAKPQKEDIPQVPKRLVTGTNADLRKLPLKEAKEICREYGVREEEINSLSRWEIIDVIRTLSTQAAKARADFSGMARFARGNIRFNFADMQDKYKKFCQHIFDLQNQTLENPEPLSTDEGSSGDDSESEELATRVESMLTAAKGKKTVMNDRQKSEYDAEEREREALQRMLRGETNVGDGAKLKADEMAPETTMDARKLKIYRTFVASDGTESVRIEVVSRPQLIEAYVRIRSTRDDAFIKHFAQMDEQYKEERRKEKRRLQDQLRRIRRNEMKAKLHGVPIGGRPVSKPKPHIEKKPLPIKPNLLKMRCSACHGTGHMKTNKNCPLYGNESPASTSTIGKIRPTQSLHSTIEEPMAPTGELIAVEGTKLKISRSFFEHQEKLKRSALRLHIPKQLLRPKTEPVEVTIDTTTTTTRPNDDAVASGSNEDEDDNVSTSTMTTNKNIKSRKPDDADYLHGPQKSVQRRRADPKVTMATHLKAIVNELKLIPNVGHLLHAVNSKKVPDYYKIITNPMDLQQIKMKITENRYELRQQFLADVKQMLDNSRLYNGDNHIITEAARQVFEIASKRIVEKEQKLMKLEKSINPLLDDNDRIGFSYILLGIIQDLKNLPKSVAFHAKVDPKKIPFYYSRISRPMDFGTMESNCKAHHYTTIDAFKRDIEQIRINSEIYNGPPEKSVYTAKAYEIVDCANALIEKNRDQLCELEANMQRAFDEVEDVESMMTGASSVADDFAVDDSRNDDDTGLQQDLAMSGDENDDVNDRIDDEFFDDEEADSSYTMSMTAQLLERSNMQRSGQLNVDLALSDSDDDDGDGTGSRSNAKRSRIDDLNMDVL